MARRGTGPRVRLTPPPRARLTPPPRARLTRAEGSAGIGARCSAQQHEGRPFVRLSTVELRCALNRDFGDVNFAPDGRGDCYTGWWRARVHCAVCSTARFSVVHGDRAFCVLPSSFAGPTRCSHCVTKTLAVALGTGVRAGRLVARPAGLCARL